MGGVVVQLAGPFIMYITLKRGDLMSISAPGIPFDKAMPSLSPLVCCFNTGLGHESKTLRKVQMITY